VGGSRLISVGNGPSNVRRINGQLMRVKGGGSVGVVGDICDGGGGNGARMFKQAGDFRN